MAQEYLLAVAGLCLLGAALAGHRTVRRARYEPRHTAEQPVVHVGATEQWSPAVDIGKPPPIDLRVQLANAEAQAGHWQRAAEQLRRRIAVQDAEPLRRALADMERNFKDQLARAGQQEIPTHEWARADIRRIVRSGAPPR